MLQKLKHSGTVPHMKKYYSIAFKFSILLSLSPVSQAAELVDAEGVRLARAPDLRGEGAAIAE